MKNEAKRLALLAIIASVLVIVVAGCTKKPAPEVRQPARAITVAEIELRPIAGKTAASGLLVPREEAAVGVELSGFRVREVLVEEGAVVKAGQPLAYLDDTLLRAKIAQAQAIYEQDRSQAERVKGFDGRGVLADEEIALRRSKALVAKAQLDDLTTQAKRMTVRAPVAGLVIERNVRPGAVSGGTEPMFRIARDRLIELDAEVPEDALADIELDSPVTVVVAGSKRFEGQVRLISPRIDPQTKLGRVRVRLPVDPDVRVGGFASASFQSEADPVPAVPENAVQFEASGPLITVIGADNRAARVAVKTGGRANGFVELINGPAVGTRVALGGGAFLLDGDLVDPESKDSAKAGPGKPAARSVAIAVPAKTRS